MLIIHFSLTNRPCYDLNCCSECNVKLIWKRTHCKLDFCIGKKWEMNCDKILFLFQTYIHMYCIHYVKQTLHVLFCTGGAVLSMCLFPLVLSHDLMCWVMIWCYGVQQCCVVFVLLCLMSYLMSCLQCTVMCCNVNSLLCCPIVKMDISTSGRLALA